MSNKLTVSFKNDDVPYSVTIECLDNPVINKWHNSVKKVYSNPPVISLNHHPNHQSLKQRETNKDWIQATYQELLNSIKGLESIGIKWPCVEPLEFNYDQQWCNRIHRYFTTMTKFKKLYVDGPDIIADTNPFIKKYYDYAHIINDCIHKIECYCVNETKKQYFMASKSLLINVPNLDYNIHETHKFYNFTQEDFQYHSWDHDCDVIFEDEILGKSIFCSFGDEDNPDYFDTSGHCGWFGSFKILADKNRQKIYEGEDFKNWLATYGLTKNSPNIRGDFPIGKIINISDPDFRELPRMRNITASSIVFHD